MITMWVLFEDKIINASVYGRVMVVVGGGEVEFILYTACIVS